MKALRTAYSSTTALGDGEFEAKIYTEPVHYQAPYGAWQEIDNELVDSVEPGYAAENKANSFTAYFPEDLATEPVRVEAQTGESVSYALEGASGSPEVSDESVTYVNAKPGIDLSYRMNPTGVEEMINLKTPEAEDSFSFDLDTSAGLEISGEGDGAQITNELGEEPFEFIPPVAYDATGDVEQMELELAGSTTSPEAELAPDSEWLAQAEYPVVVDPTIVRGTDSPDPLEVGKDCWIGKSFDYPRCNHDPILAGHTNAGNERRSILKFPLRSVISQESAINSAKLTTYVKDDPPGPPIAVSAHRIKQPWKQDAVTWTQRTSSEPWTDNGGTFFLAASDPSVTVGDTIGEETWTVTDIVKKWVNKPDVNPNDGVLLRPTSTGSTLVNFASEEALIESRKPKLSVTFVSPLSLGVDALNSYSAEISWANPPTGTTEFRIERQESTEGWRHIDTVDAVISGVDTTSYTDYLLWRDTEYTYRIKALNVNGATLATETMSDKTSVGDASAPGGTIPRMYSEESFWNRTIAQDYDTAHAPIQQPTSQFAGSEAMVDASFVDPPALGDPNPDPPNTAGAANFMAARSWGMSLVYADPASDPYSIGCIPADCPLDDDPEVIFPLPQYANLQHQGDDGRLHWGARNDGSVDSEGNISTDGKLAVINPATNEELGLYEAEYSPASDIDEAGTWEAASRYISPGGTNGSGLVCSPSPHPYRCGGPTVAGFPNMGGVVRPEEIEDGENGIKHALNITSPFTRRGVIACPATNTSFLSTIARPYSTDTRAVPIGARVQLQIPSPYTPPSTWPPVVRRLAEALRTYGAYVNDRGGTVSIQGENDIGRGYPTWKTRSGIEGKINGLTGNSDSINLENLTPPFPLEQLEVVEIDENTGVGDCTPPPP